MKQSSEWLRMRALEKIGGIESIMIRRALPIVYLALAVGVLSTRPIAYAERSPEEPTAPKNIDQTPPLVPIPNARVSEEGLLVGGQPTPEHLRAIQEAGYRMVVSLRAEGEQGDEGERAAVERLGLKFVSIPVAGPSGLTQENARALSKVLDERDVLPAVVHCSIGERAAALLGLEAFVVDRLSAPAAIDLAKRLGMKKLEAPLRERIREICKADASRNCEDLR
jgi:protein tyrosine phosphatase (PTP) superfamily phosphohydrolase (DUF442 family)